MLCQGGGPGQPTSEIDGLGQSDALRRGGHPLGTHSIIGSKNHDAANVHGIMNLSRHSREADAHGLQLAQTAGGLGQAVLPGTGGLHGFLIRRADGGKGLLQ